MKKLYLFLPLFLLTCFSVQAQIITFQKTYELGGCEGATSVQQTSDDGYIVTGYVDGGAFLFRVDANGDTLWTRTLLTGGYAYSVQQTGDGGFVIIGSSSTLGAGGADIYLMKFDSNGNTLWSKTFGGTGFEDGQDVQQTSDGGFIIAGSTNTYGSGAIDIYLIKTDASGNLSWSKTLGGTGDDFGYAVKQTFDGGYIVTGYTSSFGAGNADVYLIKTDGNGNVLWSATYGGTGSEIGYDVAETNDGKYLITGWTNDFGSGNTDIYLIKADANGNALWTKTFGGTSNEEGEVIQQSLDKGIVISGTSTSFGMENVYLLKTDSSGNIMWTKTFGGSAVEYGYGLDQTADGGYMVCGYTGSFGPQAVYLIKTDASGNTECNVSNPVTITTSPTLQVSNPSSLTSTGCAVTSPSIMTGSGGTIMTLCSTVSIDEQHTNSGIEIFPNPTNGKFVIENAFGKIKNVEVYDVMGQVIYEIPASGERVEIDLSAHANGIYFVRIKTETGIETSKIVVEK